MDLMGVSSTRTELIGRERECARIDRILDGARDGDSAALVVRGEAGIGKTALLEYAAAHAEGMLVLRALGVEAEADLAFSGLYGLLRPLVGKLDAVAERQSAALAGALGIAPSSDADRLLVSAGVLGLLAAAAEERPILCLVDDAQWLDKPSADAVVFAARRLAGERVAILFGVREGEIRAFDAPGLAEIVLDGLDAEAASAVLATQAERAAPAVRARLLSAARGNPLALLELPAAFVRGGAERGGDTSRRDSADAPPAGALPPADRAPTARDAGSAADLRGR
jgi:hypothetical protein